MGLYHSIQNQKTVDSNIYFRQLMIPESIPKISFQVFSELATAGLTTSVQYHRLVLAAKHPHHALVLSTSITFR